MDTDHFERLVANGGEAVRRRRPDYDYVAGARKNLLALEDHRCLAGEDDTRFGIRMHVHTRALPWREIALKKGNAGTVCLAFELDFSDWALPLIRWLQDLEH